MTIKEQRCVFLIRIKLCYAPFALKFSVDFNNKYIFESFGGPNDLSGDPDEPASVHKESS
jgi:hypothetical protein